jgi:hypothetical protein
LEFCSCRERYESARLQSVPESCKLRLGVPIELRFGRSTKGKILHVQAVCDSDG